MKKFTLILMLLIAVTASFAQEMTGEQIIDKVNEILSPESTHGTSKMTIITSSGEERTFVMESWAKNKGEKTLMRYLEPKRVKGQAVLMLNNADDIWMYFPRTKRVRKMATHAKKQKMQGSDFSYEDMGGGDTFINDFTVKRLDDEKMEGHECFKVELTRKADSDISYSRLILWIIQDNYVPIVMDYYDENDPQRWTKRLVQSDIEVIDGLPTAKMIVMTNKEDNTQTKMELLTVEYNMEIDDNLFTERGMKQ